MNNKNKELVELAELVANKNEDIEEFIICYITDDGMYYRLPDGSSFAPILGLLDIAREEIKADALKTARDEI